MSEEKRQRPLPLDADEKTVSAPVAEKAAPPPIRGRAMTRRQVVHEAAENVSEHIRRQPHVQRLFSFMPSLMTRVSPFHFRSRTSTRDWPLVRLDSGDRDAWGRMGVVGELLVIFDETILLTLLSLMTVLESDVFQTNCDEICALSMVPATAAGRRDVWNSIQRLAGTRIDLDLVKGKGKARQTVKAMTGSILSYGDMDRNSGAIRVVINPYFLEMYAESFVTNIDLRFRASLKSDLSKAVYRFFQGQLEIDVAVEAGRLARAVNLPEADERAALRKIRNALKELAQREYLKAVDISRDGRISVKKSKEMAVNVDRQILGETRFHIHRLGGPGRDLAK
ncbi:MAG: hypothetical protein PVG78_07905 [Desulfobacterales bacterium]|jgi:hypothetical protein